MVLAVGVVVVLAGCAGSSAVAPLGRAPSRDASPRASTGVHEVRSGETLYAIAWRHGLDYRDLAVWNGISEPFTIFAGRRLRLTRPAKLPPIVAAAPRVQAPSSTAKRDRLPPPQRSRRPSPRSSAPSTSGSGAAVRTWKWPARGTVVTSFRKSGRKGIDISGERGGAVVAAAPGRVVYSGSGLRGYGKLIIVKHNKRYLSAYAHNDHLHVKEGDTVASGQRIADMGSTDAKTVKLHFEIRRDGKPVDPIRFLPR
jgi:lipoprotein NlpD